MKVRTLELWVMRIQPKASLQHVHAHGSHWTSMSVKSEILLPLSFIGEGKLTKLALEIRQALLYMDDSDGTSHAPPRPNDELQ